MSNEPRRFLTNRRFAEKLEIHFTPKDGSWLNMAETELSELTRQRVDRRFPDRDALVDEFDAWQSQRNDADATIDWQFTTKDARIKRNKLYPSTQV